MSDTKMERGRHKPWSELSVGGKVLLIVVIAIGILCLFTLCGAVAMWLWNALMPAIFKLPAIGFWQAIGLIVLSHILFKGGNLGRAGRSHWKKRQVWKHMREDEAKGAE
jgi:hypothetical protein